jgi:hypothetical protein
MILPRKQGESGKTQTHGIAHFRILARNRKLVEFQANQQFAMDTISTSFWLGRCSYKWDLASVATVASQMIAKLGFS